MILYHGHDDRCFSRRPRVAIELLCSRYSKDCERVRVTVWLYKSSFGLYFAYNFFSVSNLY